ncbi:MAG: YSC84-related protein [Gammaproteobacteria bacterium]|nr:YSC84-related protein [Gammaproteobacteria bacterium]MDP2142061.1 YSC84-related protein [Gammaproteobacteria bacterium]MDP2348360.1 YSC84-related protein [Gammaproteobacteria bacterium]
MNIQSTTGNTIKITPVVQLLKAVVLTLATGFALLALSSGTYAATAEDLNQDSRQALERLYSSDPVAPTLASRAKAILVFPNIVKAGLVFGGSYGEGVLIKGNQITDYYNSVTASWGLQVGAQSYGYALFLMTDEAVSYLEDTDGWELGVGPTVVVVTEGIAANLSTSTIQNDAYAFIFDQQGLMAGVSIEGTKISHIQR